MTFNLEFLYIILLITYLEGILSIDNAAVLGAMVSGLPQTEPIPWPRALRFLTQSMHRLLGEQRSAALKVGLLGAYIGRGSMLLLATFIIHNPWLKILGALYLIKLALENLGEAEPGEEAQVELQRVTNKDFWGVVLGVELADLAFSLDNVVAVVAISDNFTLVMFGVAMGILTMRFAASLFTRLIEREPLLKPAAYILVLNIGTELLLEEFLNIHIDTIITFAISLLTLLFAVAYAHIRILHVLQPVLHWLGEGMGNVNELANWALRPVIYFVKIIFKGILFFYRAIRSVPSQEPSSSTTITSTSPGDS